MKKSELEQIIREEVEAVLVENIFQKGFNKAYKYLKGKIKGAPKQPKQQKPKSRTGVIRNFNLFNKIKKIEVHQPKLDKMGRPSGADILKIERAEAENIISQALAPLKGNYDILADQLRKGNQQRVFDIPDIGKKDFEGSQLILKHIGGKDVPLNIQAIIRKIPLDSRGKRLPATDVHTRKSTPPKYPGDKRGNWSYQQTPTTGRGSTMPPPPRP